MEYTTGLSARIGYPTSYMAKDNKEEMKHPMFSTGIGLVLEGYKEYSELKPEQAKEFFPELFTNDIPQPTEFIEKEILAEPIEKIEVEMEPETELSEEHVDRDKNILVKLTKVFKNWFEDERVNGDFE